MVKALLNGKEIAYINNEWIYTDVELVMNGNNKVLLTDLVYAQMVTISELSSRIQILEDRLK